MENADAVQNITEDTGGIVRESDTYVAPENPGSPGFERLNPDAEQEESDTESFVDALEDLQLEAEQLQKEQGSTDVCQNSGSPCDRLSDFQDIVSASKLGTLRNDNEIRNNTNSVTASIEENPDTDPMQPSGSSQSAVSHVVEDSSGSDSSDNDDSGSKEQWEEEALGEDKEEEEEVERNDPEKEEDGDDDNDTVVNEDVLRERESRMSPEELQVFCLFSCHGYW